MKAIPELELGFRDAENYKRSENRQLFEKVFLRTSSLEELCERHVYFLIGEKGTGKTAYAVYLQNTAYKKQQAELKYIRETEYQKFVELKNANHLTLSDYMNIWKVIVYILMAENISANKRGVRYGFQEINSKILRMHSMSITKMHSPPKLSTQCGL